MADSTLNITVKTESKELQSLVDRLNKGDLTVKEYNKTLRELRSASLVGSEGQKQLKEIVTQVSNQTATANAKMMQSYFKLGQQIRANVVALQSWAAAAAGLMGLRSIIQGSERLVMVLSQLEQSLKGTGVSAKEMMSALRGATGREVSDLKLAQIALEFRLAGAEIKQIPALMAFAEQRADTLGKSFDEVANSLIKLTQGAGERVARELRIPIESVTKAEDEFAKSIGTTREMLNDTGKRRAFYNALLKESQKQQDLLTGADTRGVSALDQMDAALENLKTSFSGLYPVIKVVATAIMGLSSAVYLIAGAVAYLRNDFIALSEWGGKVKEIGDQIRSMWGADLPAKGLPSGIKETKKPRGFFIDTEKDIKGSAKALDEAYAARKKQQDQLDKRLEYAQKKRDDAAKKARGPRFTESSDPVDIAEQTFNDIGAAAQSMTAGIFSGFNNMASQFSSAWQSMWARNIGNTQTLLAGFIQGIVDQFAQMAARMAAMQILSFMFPSLGGFTAVSKLFGAASGGDFAPGGSRLQFAASGTNINYGKLQNVIVGERGPELMQVGMNGVRVISNENMNRVNQVGQAGRYGGEAANQMAVYSTVLIDDRGISNRVEIGKRKVSGTRL